MSRLVRGVFVVALAVAASCSGSASAATDDDGWVAGALAQSRCAGQVVVTWVAVIPSSDGELHIGAADGAVDGGCGVRIIESLRGTARGCDVEVHEALHLAGFEHSEHGVMSRTADPYPPCHPVLHPVLTRRARAVDEVQALLPHGGLARSWRITCNVGTTRCRATAPGARFVRRYSVLLVDEAVAVDELGRSPVSGGCRSARSTSRARHACSACRARRQQRFPTTFGARCG